MNIKIKDEMLKAVQEFFYQRDRLSAECGCKLAVATHLQMFMGKIMPNVYQIPLASMCWFCGSDRRLGYSTCVRSVMPLWRSDGYVMSTSR